MTEQQQWDADRYQENASFVPELGRSVLELLAPRPGERILDLGCGDGVLTAALAEAGAMVVGVDASPELVRVARERGLEAFLSCVEALLASSLRDEAGQWTADYVRLRFYAQKESTKFQE